MIVERDLRSYVVLDEEPLTVALEKISANRQRIVFCVNGAGQLVGSLSDGDIRRWLLSQPTIELTTPARAVARRDCASAPADATAATIGRLFDQRIGHIPLVDERGRLVAVAVAARGSSATGD